MDHALDPSFSVGNDLLHPERSNKSMEKTLSVCLVYLEPEFSFFVKKKIRVKIVPGLKERSTIPSMCFENDMNPGKVPSHFLALPRLNK